MLKSAFYVQKLEPDTTYAPQFIVKGRNEKSKGKVLGGYTNKNAESNAPVNCLLIGKNTLTGYYVELMALYDEQPTFIPIEAFKEGEQYWIQLDYFKIVQDNTSPAVEYDFTDSEFQMFGYFLKNFNYF